MPVTALPPPAAEPTLARRFFRLTLLNLLANVTEPLAGVVDTGMLGHLPDIRFLAGVALASLLFAYLYWTFGFLRLGTTGPTAQALGSGDRREAYFLLYRTLLVAAVAGAVLVLLQWPIQRLGFAILSGSPGVESAGRSYFAARIWGAPAVLANFALVGWFLGREESGRALAMTLVANLANVGLDALFILHFGWAAWGAGLATMASQYLMLATGLALFLAVGRREGRPAWSTRDVLRRDRLKALVQLNRDILVRTLGLVTSFAVFINLGSLLGTRVLAANAILLQLFEIAAYLIDGAAFAVESLAGLLHGAGRRLELRRLVTLSLVTSEAFALAFLAVLAIAPRRLYGLLTSHPEVVELAVRYGPWLAPVLLIGAAAFLYDGLFLGLTAGRALRISMLFSSLVVFVPAAFVALELGSNHLLWLALTLFMVARTATLGWASLSLLAVGR